MGFLVAVFVRQVHASLLGCYLEHFEIYVNFRFPRVLGHDLLHNIHPPRLTPRTKQRLPVLPPTRPKARHFLVQNALHLSRFLVDQDVSPTKCRHAQTVRCDDRVADLDTWTPSQAVGTS